MKKLLRMRMIRLTFVAVLAITMLVTLSALPHHAALRTPPSGVILVIDPAASKVQWTLGTTLHTVHGTFAVKNGTLQLDTVNGKIGGEIVVDAGSGQSGDESRDKKMHKDVLESGRYTEVIFRPDRLDGKVAPQGASKVQIHGILAIHGAEHELAVPVEAELGTDGWTGSAKFSVPFIDWGLKNPSNFLLKVKHTVDIELELKGKVKRTAAS
jgi:polyisoprenoid-binding protein YceI